MIQNIDVEPLNITYIYVYIYLYHPYLHLYIYIYTIYIQNLLKLQIFLFFSEALPNDNKDNSAT